MRIIRLAACVLCVAALCACREGIIHNLTESEVNRLMTRLHDARIAAEKERQADGRWALTVAEADALKAIKFLDQSRLLRQDNTTSVERRSALLGEDERRLHNERLLSRGIAETLANIAGVLEARVHLNLPPRDPLFGRPLGENFASSASVLVVAAEDLSARAEEIAQLVAGAAGLQVKDVHVLINRAAASAGELPTDAAAMLEAGDTNQNLKWRLSTGVITKTASVLLLGFALFCVYALQRRRQKRTFLAQAENLDERGFEYWNTARDTDAAGVVSDNDWGASRQ